MPRVSMADRNQERLKRRFLRTMGGFSDRDVADKHGFLPEFEAAKTELERDLVIRVVDAKGLGTRNVDQIVATAEAERQRMWRGATPLEVPVLDYAQKFRSKNFRGSERVAMCEYCSSQLSDYAERSGLRLWIAAHRRQPEGGARAHDQGGAGLAGGLRAVPVDRSPRGRLDLHGGLPLPLRRPGHEGAPYLGAGVHPVSAGERTMLVRPKSQHEPSRAALAAEMPKPMAATYPEPALVIPLKDLTELFRFEGFDDGRTQLFVVQPPAETRGLIGPPHSVEVGSGSVRREAHLHLGRVRLGIHPLALNNVGVGAAATDQARRQQQSNKNAHGDILEQFGAKA
ncbi:hypothetical protein EON82_24430 [bacterium]|nr:MAG: hypothetical protein EON82_24430 [bacterium]